MPERFLGLFAVVKFTLDPLFQDNGLPLAVMGIFVVFVALALVITCITLLPRILTRLFPDGVSPSMDPNVTPPDELSPETVAVIAAAVSTVMRGPHRVIRIRGLTADDLGWALEGRLHHHQSHAIKNRGGR